MVDKTEVGVEEGVVFAVDDGDGQLRMGCEGSDLAPVAILFLFWVGLVDQRHVSQQDSSWPRLLFGCGMQLDDLHLASRG